MQTNVYYTVLIPGIWTVYMVLSYKIDANLYYNKYTTKKLNQMSATFVDGNWIFSFVSNVVLL